MEIIRKQEKYEIFERLNIGEVFMSDNKIYMKTLEIFDEDYGDFNCVNLQDGQLDSMPDGKSVKIITCKLYVE